MATDGRRLAFVGKDLGANITGQFIVPTKTVAEIQRLFSTAKEATIGFKDKQIVFKIDVLEKTALVDSIYLVSKLVDGEYPDYKKVIPKEVKNHIQLERELLLECLERVSIIVSDRDNCVRLIFNNNVLHIEAHSSEYGKSKESLDVTYDGDEIILNFNPKYLIEPLKGISEDKVYFEFESESSPGVLKTLNNFLCVIMPMNVSV